MKKLYSIIISINLVLNAQIEGTWRLAQIPGALAVGPTLIIHGGQVQQQI